MAALLLGLVVPLLAPASAPAAPSRSTVGSAPAATPARASSGPAGALLGAAPFVAHVLPLIPFDARAWRLRYRSELQDGRAIEVTGTLLVPTTPWAGPGPRPIVSLAVGTQGLADRCAASQQLAQGTEYEAYTISQLLGRNWAVAITDYPGLGTPGDHTFVVGRANGRAVLDVVRAARQVPGSGLAPDGRVMVFGYSEGGNAAGWALQLQPTYAPELDVVAGAVGAPPADFLGMWSALDGSPFAFLLLYTGIGFDAAYPQLKLDTFLNDRGRRAADLLRRTCIVGAIGVGAVLPKDSRAYLARDVINDLLWRETLRSADLGHLTPPMPVILGAARQDEVIPFRQAADLRDRWCARGAKVAFVDVPLGEHLSGIVSFAGPAIAFLADRLADRAAGRPAVAPGGCG